VTSWKNRLALLFERQVAEVVHDEELGCGKEADLFGQTALGFGLRPGA
jgi:hypothetical protein